MDRRKTTDFDTLRRLANQGDADACFDIAESYYAQKNYSEAFKWYKKTISCKNPNPVAFFNIAYALQFGEGVAVDIAASLEYYQKAATYELPQAMYNLAFFYQNGIIVPKDVEKAVRLCREATLKLNEFHNKLFRLQKNHEKLTEGYNATIKLIDDSNERVKLLENKCGKAETENQNLYKDNHRLTDEITKSNNQLKEANRQNTLLTTEKQKLSKIVSHSETLITEKDNLILSLNSDISQLNQTNNKLSTEYHDLQSRIEELRGENKALEISLKNKEEEYKNILIRNSQLVEQLNTKEDDFGTLMQKYVSLSENYHHLNSDFELEKQEKKASESRVVKLSNEKNMLERTIAQRNSDYSLKEEMLNSRIQQLNSLKNKLWILIGILGGGLGISLTVLIISLFNF